MTQQQFAERIGVSVSAAGTWETDERRPSPKYLRKMAEAAPLFADEIQVLIRGYRHKQPSPGRIPPELRDSIIVLLDEILETGPLPIVEDVKRILTERADNCRRVKK